MCLLVAALQVKGDAWRYMEAIRMPYDVPAPEPAPQRETVMDNGKEHLEGNCTNCVV